MNIEIICRLEKSQQDIIKNKTVGNSKTGQVEMKKTKGTKGTV